MNLIYNLFKIILSTWIMKIGVSDFMLFNFPNLGLKLLNLSVRIMDSVVYEKEK